MQTLGYIQLFNRNGEKTDIMPVLYRISTRKDGYSYLKRRKPSKNLGVLFDGESQHIQSIRFNGDVSEAEAEAEYQHAICRLNNGESIGC